MKSISTTKSRELPSKKSRLNQFLNRFQMKTIFLFTAALFFSASLLFAETPPKTDVNSVENESLSWDLSDIYADWDAWQSDFDALQGMLEKISTYKGRLSESADTFIEMLQLEEELRTKAGLV